MNESVLCEKHSHRWRFVLATTSSSSLSSLSSSSVSSSSTDCWDWLARESSLEVERRLRRGSPGLDQSCACHQLLNSSSAPISVSRWRDVRQASWLTSRRKSRSKEACHPASRPPKVIASNLKNQYGTQ